MLEDPSLANPHGSSKRLLLRYPGTCRLCGASLPARTEALYESITKTVQCVACPPLGQAVSDRAAPPQTASSWPAESAGSGTAGSSARREYQRRKAKDEQRLRRKWGRLGGLAVALSGERQSTTAWAQGAVGEERLGARLDSLASDDIAILHDRRIPGTKGNIDHLAVTRAGIWVIDTKRYQGRPELRIEGGILRPRTEKLIVGRRDCTKLVDGILKQADLVRQVMGDIPVTGALCFVDADWPLIGGAFTTRGIHVLWPARLAKVLTEAHAGGIDVPATRDLLASRLRSS